PLNDRQGVEAIVVMASDVTARVVARERAERSAAEAAEYARVANEAERTLDALMAYVPAGIAIAEAPGMRVRRVSYRGLALTKRPWQEVVEDLPAERIPERWQIYRTDGSTIAEPEAVPLSRAIRKGEIVVNEPWLLRHHDGRLIPVLCNAGPIRDADGEITGGVMSWIDVSAVENSRRALLETARRFELAIEAADLGLWDHDLISGELTLSGRGRVLLGLSAEVVPTHERFLAAIHPEDRGDVDAAIRRSLRANGDGLIDVTFRVPMPDGPMRWVAMRGHSFCAAADGRRRPVRMIGTLGDVTAQVHALAEKERLLAQKNLLLREVNHRVTNSLQLIASLLHLQGLSQSAEVRRRLEETRTRVLTVAQLHQHLYQSDRVEKVEISSYLRKLCEDLPQTLGHASGSRLRLDADVADVPTDIALSLGLIVNELVTNAFKYAYGDGQDGDVDVRLEVSAERLCLTVSDLGQGLPSGFDPERSNGLGMRIVASLATRLDAQFDFSPPGRGASFRISIPRRRAQDDFRAEESR
ncbi:MAG TPA: histidine kinase dimerization/phosphoacceptor domain -containing protein, partial [Alphaproteobacteria bacterium]